MFVLAVAILVAANAPAESAAPAAEPGPFAISDGQPLDFDWARSRFESGQMGSKAWAVVREWADERAAMRLRTISQSLPIEERNHARFQPGCLGDDRCDWIRMIDALASEERDWESFAQAVREARAVYLPYAAGVDVTAATIHEAPGPLSGLERAHARAQAFRMDASLVLRFAPGVTLSPVAKRLLDMMLRLRARAADRAALTIVRPQIEAHRWPRRSEVGDDLARDVWMAVQHADYDPDLQFEALDVMKPLLPSEEASRADFGALFDRAMLNIGRPQRYGTQLSVCRDGYLWPDHLEDPARVDIRRAALGMQPLREYVLSAAYRCG